MIVADEDRPALVRLALAVLVGRKLYVQLDPEDWRLLGLLGLRFKVSRAQEVRDGLEDFLAKAIINGHGEHHHDRDA